MSAEAETGSPLTAATTIHDIGGVAQLGERLLCKQEVIGSIPFTSTTLTPQASGGELRLTKLNRGGPTALEQTSFRTAPSGAVGCGGGIAVAGSLTL